MAEEEVQLGVLVRTIEHEIIPRLMLAHRADPQCLDIPEGVGGISPVDIEMFVKLVLAPDELLACNCIEAMRMRGVSPEDICLGLLAPVARRLGQLWQQDLCDFTEVTYGLGRLHHLLRDLGPSFGRGPDAPANGYRVLLVPAPGEQHLFGLMMVAEFFRHEGWDVEVGLAEGGTDAAAAVRDDWFDVVGFSLGDRTHLPDLTQVIERVRAASSNRRVCIMLGGSLLQSEPDLARILGADSVVVDGRTAPALAQSLVASRGGARRR